MKSSYSSAAAAAAAATTTTFATTFVAMMLVGTIGSATASASGIGLPSSVMKPEAGAVPPSKFEVQSLPGWTTADGKPAALPSQMFTGYLDAGTPPNGKGTMYFHYWCVMSETDPENDPVLLWYNGGPGASSLFGLLQEWGPLRLNANSYDEKWNATGIPTPQFNAWSWTRQHTVIAIDSPPPMGLSYCTPAGPSGSPTSCGPWTDKTTFAANHEAHKTLFNEVFPELKKNPVMFTGESYAGLYVPGFVNAMLDDPIPGLNLQGWAVGDGWTGCREVEGRPPNWCVNLDNVGTFKYPNVFPGPRVDVEFFHGHTQFSNELYREIIATCSDRQLDGEEALDTNGCADLIDEMARQVGGFFPYNVFNGCPNGDMLMLDKHGINQALRSRRHNGFATMTFVGDTNDPRSSGLGSPCLGQAMGDWFKLPETLEAIGALPNSSFINLDNGHGFDYTSDQTFVGPIYERALEAGLRVLVYEGDMDACGLQTSPVEDIFVPLFNEFGMTKTKPWSPWTLDGAQRMGGYVISWNHGRANFASIRGSGHLAPLNRAHATFLMIQKFAANESLPVYVTP